MKKNIKQQPSLIRLFKKRSWLLMILTFVFLINKWGVAQSSVKNDYSNPLLIYGTSFGVFFQTLYKQGKFEEMLNFTSNESISKYGREKIKEYYQKTSFGYKIKLTSYYKESEVYILNYQSIINATDCIIRMPIVIENDTSKILLPFTFLNQHIFLFQ